MNTFIIFLLVSLVITSCPSQETNTPSISKSVGGPCEGCEAIYEYGNMNLNNTYTLPAYHKNEPKIKISGTVFKEDGETPAENIILYIYHTNRKGVYETLGNEEDWARRHGHIRGWVKTGEDGKYSFSTFRPGAYPGRSEPEHIHMIVKEPNINEYYIDDILFDDDPLLTNSKRDNLANRGGSGIVVPKIDGNIVLVERNITLGHNIPNYD